MKNIPDILRALADLGVQFVVVGGFAVQLHGFVRTTIDLDLVLAMDDLNLSKFIEVANQFGLAPIIPVSIESLKYAQQLDQWHREKGMLAFALREPQVAGSVIDVLVRPEVAFNELQANAVRVDLFNRTVKIASIEHLLCMKRIAKRPKDRVLRRLKKSSEEKTLMSDILKIPPTAITAHDANVRWQQSLQLCAAFAQIWIQNPQLARQAGRRVEEYVMPLSEVQRRHFDDLN